MLFDLKLTKQVSTEIDVKTFLPSKFATLPFGNTAGTFGQQ